MLNSLLFVFFSPRSNFFQTSVAILSSGCFNLGVVSLFIGCQSCSEINVSMNLSLYFDSILNVECISLPDSSFICAGYRRSFGVVLL